MVDIDGLTVADTSCNSGGQEFLLLDRQAHLGRSEGFYRVVTHLTTPEGVQSGSRITMRADPSYQKIVIHRVDVIRNGKVMHRLRADDVRVLQQEADMATFMYDGSRTLVVDLDDVQVGDIIDHAYTTIGSNPVNEGHFSSVVQMGYAVPIARSRTRLLVPTGRTLRYQAHGLEAERVVTSSPIGEEWRWEQEQVPCTVAESGTPGWYLTYPQLEFTEWKDLDDLRRWAIALYEVDEQPDPALTRVIDRLKSIRDPVARIDSAIHVVQREVRYLGLEAGISAYKPHPPSQVYAQRYGDCKDRSLLLVTLLNRIGVDAWPALVSTTEGRTLPERLPRPTLFDHCIVLLRNGTQEHWVDPTMTHSMGSLHERYAPDLDNALVLDPERSRWTRMRVERRGSAETEERFVLDSVGGGAVLRVQTVYKAAQADKQRSYFAGSSMSSIGTAYLDYYQRLYGTAEALEPMRMQDDPGSNTITIDEAYRFHSIWEGPDSNGIRRFTATPEFLRSYIATSDIRYRSSPLALGDPVHVVQRIMLKMPSDWPLDIPARKYEGFGVHYMQTSSAFADSILLEYAYTIDSTFLGAEDSPEFRDQQERILDNLGATFSQGEGAEEIQSRTHWSYAAVCLFVALAIFGALRLYRYDPPVRRAIGPAPITSIGGWMILPLIGLVLSPLLQLADILTPSTDFLMMPVNASYAAVSDPGLYQLYCYYAQAYAIGMFAFTVVVNILFFKRRTSVPMMMVILYGGAVFNLYLDCLVYAVFDLESLIGEPYGMKDVVRSTISACIWIPFFLISTRVRSTFRKRHDGSVDSPAML